MSDNLNLILKEMNDAGKASQQAGAKDDGLGAVRRVAENYGYDYEDLDDTFAYYREYGVAPTQNAGAFLREVAGGLAFEFSDEIEAGARSIFADETYEEILERVRMDRRAYFDRNPATAIGANVVGGFLTPAGVLGSVGRGAMKAAPVLTSMAVGAGQGALTGIGASEDKSAIDALAGGVLGGAFGAAGGKIGTVLANRGLSTYERGLLQGRDALDQDGVDLARLPDRIKANVEADKAIGLETPEMLADYGGDATVRRLRGATVASGKVSDDVGQTISNRQVGAGGLINPNLQNPDQIIISQGGRLQSELVKMQENIRGKASGELVEQIDRQQKKNPKIRELYDTAYGRNTNFKNENIFKAIVGNDDLRESYKLARERFINRYNGRQKFEEAERFATLVPENVDDLPNSAKGIPLEFLDAVKRQVGDELWKHKNNKTLSKQELDERRATLAIWIDSLKKAVDGDEYETVLKKTADQFEISDAEEIGKKLFGKAPSQMREAIGGMNTAQLDAVRLSYLEEMIERIGKAGKSTDKVTTVLGKENADEVLTVLFEGNEDLLSNFLGRVNREQNMTKTRRSITGQSATADKLADERMLDGGTILDIGRVGTGYGSPETYMRLASKFNPFSGVPTTKTAQGVNQVLGEINPNQQIDAIERMRRLNETLATMNLRKPLVGGSVGSVLGTQSGVGINSLFGN